MNAARVCVQRSPAYTIAPAATVQRRGRIAASRSSTTTSAYAVASGLRKVETRRRAGLSSSVLRIQFSGSPERHR